MLRFFLLAILFIILESVSAEQVDSLRLLLSTAQGEQEVDLLNDIAQALLPEAGLREAQEAIQKAQSLNYIKGEADGNYLLGNYFFDYSNIRSAPEALTCYSKSIELYASISLDSMQIQALKGALRAHYHLDQFELSLQDAIDIEKIAGRIRDAKSQAYAYVHHSRIYARIMEDYVLSRSYLLKALDICKQTRDSQYLSRIYNDLGNGYYQTEQYDSAHYYYQQGLSLAEVTNRRHEVQLLKINIAATYKERLNYPVAKQLLQDFLQDTSQNKDRINIMSAYLQLGDIYKKEQNDQQAILYLEKGLKVAQEYTYFVKIAEAYKLLKEIYAQQGVYDKAFAYSDSLLNIKDSINTHLHFEQLTKIKSAYELEKKEKEISFLEKQTEMQKQISNAILVGAILLTFTLLLLFNLSTLRSRLQKKRLESMKSKNLLEEKEKLRLQDQLAHKERELASQTVFILQKNKLLSQLKEQIKNIQAANTTGIASDLKTMSRTIKQNMNFDDDWHRFKLHFEEVHPHFFSKLHKEFPNLNSNEIRFCTYIRMGLITKEIAQLQGINASSVQKTRYRIKKKMDLEKNLNLVDFIAHY